MSVKRNERPNLIALAGGAVTTSGSTTWSVNCFVAARLPSLARTVNVAETVCVGVPLMAPAPLRVSPAGSAPAVTAQLVAVPPEVDS